MKKLLTAVIILLAVWLVKLNYETYSISKNISDAQREIANLQHNNAILNDHIVAIQRNTNESLNTVADQAKGLEPSRTTLNPILMLRQQMELIQFALQQRQYLYALEKLQEIERTLSDYDLAPALEQSLRESIERDKDEIQKVYGVKEQQKQVLNDFMKLIDQDLEMAQEYKNLKLNSQEPPSFWQKWFQVQRVERVAPDLMNRQMLLKEVQLRLLLARQAIHDGRLTDYQDILSLITQVLTQFPDRQSQDLLARLEHLKELMSQPEPKLVTREILG